MKPGTGEAGRSLRRVNRSRHNRRRDVHEIGAIRSLIQRADACPLGLVGLARLEFREFAGAVEKRDGRNSRGDLPDRGGRGSRGVRVWRIRVVSLDG